MLVRDVQQPATHLKAMRPFCQIARLMRKRRYILIGRCTNSQVKGFLNVTGYLRSVIHTVSIRSADRSKKISETKKRRSMKNMDHRAWKTLARHYEWQSSSKQTHQYTCWVPTALSLGCTHKAESHAIYDHFASSGVFGHCDPEAVRDFEDIHLRHQVRVLSQCAIVCCRQVEGLASNRYPPMSSFFALQMVS
jgi:hypothetical protein